MVQCLTSCKWCGKEVEWNDNPAIARCKPGCSKSGRSLGFTSKVGSCDCCMSRGKTLSADSMHPKDKYKDWNEQAEHCVSCGREL